MWFASCTWVVPAGAASSSEAAGRAWALLLILDCRKRCHMSCLPAAMSQPCVNPNPCISAPYAAICTAKQGS